jgi:aspartate/glutamate racemase
MRRIGMVGGTSWDVTADAARRAGLTRVGPLGTAFTMEQPFFI